METLHRWFNQLLQWLRSGSERRSLAVVKRELFVLVQTARASQDEEVARRAAALTYHTLLSLVPLLAVAFALFKAFGGFQKLQEPLEDLIFSQLAIANSEQVADWLTGFVEQVNSGAIAGIGVLVLFYTAAGLLTNIEQAFNRVWNVRLRRPLYVRLAIYWCILTLAPPIVALSISFSTDLINRTVSAWFGEAAAGALLALVSPVTVGLVFFVIYVMVPDTHVRWKDAAVGAVAAAICWNAAKAAFLWSTKASSKYSAIYGAMSALPLLMIWIYTSWSIVLFGASYARQRSEPMQLDVNREAEQSPPTIRLLARTVVALWEHFHAGRSITAETIAQEIGVTLPVCRAALDVLTDHELVECTGAEDAEGTEYLLRRHLGDMTLLQLEAMLIPAAVRTSESKVTGSRLWRAVEERLDQADGARAAHLDVTIERVASSPPVWGTRSDAG